jgi:hypothetical protein
MKKVDEKQNGVLAQMLTDMLNRMDTVTRNGRQTAYFAFTVLGIAIVHRYGNKTLMRWVEEILEDANRDETEN